MNLQANNTFTAHPVSASMQQILEQLISSQYQEQAMLDQVSHLIHSFPLEIEDFPVVTDSYSRTILHRDGSGGEAMVARWSKGAITPIHGHPQFTFVYLICGELCVERYEKKANLVKKQHSTVYHPGQHLYSQGTPNAFDNAIHRVLANEESLSLHIYSDNALKGEIFS